MTLLTQILSLIALIVAAYFIHSGFKYTRMISNIFLSLVYNPPQEEIPATVGQKINILDSGDREIEALLVERAGAKKIVIFCHESGASKESWEKYAYFLPDFGFHVLSVDLNKSAAELDQNSLLQWPLEEDVERLLTVIRWTHKAFSSDLDVVLFGISNGADIALAASFRHAGVKAVIADGLFSMKEIFRDYIRKWAPVLVKPNLFGEKYPEWIVNLFTNLGFWFCQKKSGKKFVDVERLLGRTGAPLLMIHGEKDDYVPETHQKFLENLSSGREIIHVVIPEARHNQAVVIGRQVYERKITEFLRKVKQL